MTDAKKDVKVAPRWTTSWPDWYGVSGNVEVVPAIDLEHAQLERDHAFHEWNHAEEELKAERLISKQLRERIAELERSNDRHAKDHLKCINELNLAIKRAERADAALMRTYKD